ncbi:MAG: DUF5063 domain-containing protein [Pyrinomonadaceae bacterium]|nr:DUF5063 domain-containing protein [Pyrinomonadaceae bacterium]
MRQADRTAGERFAEIARRFCKWAEGLQSEGGCELEFVRRILAELHLAVLDLTLPETTGEEQDPPEIANWNVMMTRFGNLPFDGYWDVFDPMSEEAPVFNTLSDDLTDIYRDLARGLLLFDQGRFVEADWEWRINFDIHWGAHLTGAQRAIHAYFSNPDNQQH